jgi:DNA-directed RNA polymerase subunit RPC12/RpoP
MRKLKIEFIRAEFKKEGYELLTEVYENKYTRLDYVCSRDHKHNTHWKLWNSSQKVRCPYCYGNAKLKIEFIRTEFAKEDYILLTTVYEGNKQKLEYVCPNGHQRFITWNDWSQGKRCPCFSNQMRPTIEFIRAEFAKEGYVLLTTVYENARQKLEYICPRGHKHFVRWNKWNSKRKQRCPFCSNTGVSKWEKTVKSFLTESNINHISNDRKQLLNPETGYNLELDIWMPKLNKAIECNGVYWHEREEAIVRDKIKKQLCKDQGIDLLVITDKEWNDNTDKCKAKLISFVEAGD